MWAIKYLLYIYADHDDFKHVANTPAAIFQRRYTIATDILSCRESTEEPSMGKGEQMLCPYRKHYEASRFLGSCTGLKIIILMVY